MLKNWPQRRPGLVHTKILDRTGPDIYSGSQIRDRRDGNPGLPYGHHHSPAAPTKAVSEHERAFFIELGQRIAQRRKELDITQAQFADMLGVVQQAMNSFGKGPRRILMSALPATARAVGASLDELIVDAALAPVTAPRKRGPAPKIHQQVEQLSRLPKPKQRAVMQVLDSVLAQAEH